MKALIVTAHPEPASFTVAMSRVTERELQSLGYEILRSDLYAMRFSAGAGSGDFEFAGEGPLDMQERQLAATRSGDFSPELAQEIEKLRSCDLLVLHFPLWWFSMPGLMKGWIDRVFAYGFAYGRHGSLAGRSAMVVTSTGGPEESYTEAGRGTVEGFLKHLLVGTLALCSLEVLPTFVAYGPKRQANEERSETLLRLAAHVRRCCSTTS